MEHPQSESEMKGWPSWMENWFMWHHLFRRLCQHHPPVKAAGKRIASCCTKLPLRSAGWYSPGRHSALLESTIPESREKWGRNLPASSPLLLLVSWSDLNTPISKNQKFPRIKISTKSIFLFLVKFDLKVSVSSAWGILRHSYSVPINLSLA